VIVKAYDLTRISPLFANDPEAEFATLKALEGRGFTPDPMNLTQIGPWPVLIYKALPQQSTLTPHAAGALLARLHAIAPPSWLPRAAQGTQVLEEAARMAPKLDLSGLIPPKNRPAVFLHRDPVPANFVVTKTAPHLIDWQSPGAGNPLEDVAQFISPAMRHLYGAAALSTADLTAFFDGYDPKMQAIYAADGAAFHARIAAYCLWQAAHGAEDYTAALAHETSWVQLLTQGKAPLEITSDHAQIMGQT